MSISSNHCSAVILSGGRSRRMGICKAMLKIEGETMLSRLTSRLDCFEEILLSTNDPILADGLPLRVVFDIYHNAGPLAGLHAALLAARHDVLFCVPCDMPNFVAELPQLLLKQYNGEDALVCQDSTMRLYPLCGLYARSILPRLEAQLQHGHYRASELLRGPRCTAINMNGLIPDDVYFNMNTPEEYWKVSKVWAC